MKKKIKVIDKINNKVINKEIIIRDLDHFESQKKFKSQVYTDKTKVIPRKQKYKPKVGDDV